MNIEPLFIDVITATDDPNAPPYRTDRINYGNSISRRWLANHSLWALTNGYSVHTRACKTERN